MQNESCSYGVQRGVGGLGRGVLNGVGSLFLQGLGYVCMLCGQYVVPAGMIRDLQIDEQ
jgi:hypothetical protein